MSRPTASPRPDRQSWPPRRDRQGEGPGDRQPWPSAASRDRQIASQPRPPAGTASPDRQTWRSATAASADPPTTHEVVVPPPAGAVCRRPGAAVERRDDATATGAGVGRIPAAIANMRFAITTPMSPKDRMEYARSGLYSDRPDGPWRNVNILYVRFFADPCNLLVGFFLYAFAERLDRALRYGFVLACLFTLLNALPVTRWLTPDWLDITSLFRSSEAAPAPAPAGVG